MKKLPKTIYHLILQDNGRKGQIVTNIISETPFPRMEHGDQLTIEHTQPRNWDVRYALTKIEHSSDLSELHISTFVSVDSPCEREPVPEVVSIQNVTA